MTRSRWLLLLLLLMASCAQAQIKIDANTPASFDAAPATTVSDWAFSTGAANELLLAFVELPANANQHVTKMAGCGLTNWALVKRTNSLVTAVSGDAEIWQAFAAAKLLNCVVTATLYGKTPSSITVIAFTGASSVVPLPGASAGSASNPPSLTYKTTANGSWVFGNGDAPGHGVVRTVASGQTIVHEFVSGNSGSGNDLWVQQLNSPTALGGSNVTLNDTAPSAYAWNLTAVEVLAAGPPVKTLSSIAVSPTTATATIGGAPVQFAAKATYSDSSTADVTTAASWTSSTGAATIGLHTGTATGVTTVGSPATITASYTENSVTKTSTAALTVKAAPYVSLSWAEGKPDTPPTTYAPQRGPGTCPAVMTNLKNGIMPTSYQDNGPFVKGQIYCYDVTETDATTLTSKPSTQVQVTPYP